MKKIITITSLIFFIIGIILFFFSSQDIKEIIKSKSPDFLLTTYRSINKYVNEKKILKNTIENYKALLEYEQNFRIEKELILEDIPNLVGNIFFEKKINSELIISNKKLKYKTFDTKYLFIPKNDNVKATAYLEYINEKVIIATATGIFSFTDIKKLNENKFSTTIIKSNIKSFINNNEFFVSGRYGIKDLLIYQNKIFVSYSNQITDDCYNTSIIFADFNLDKLEFEKLFNPTFCSKNKSRQNGGRIVGYKKDKILYTHGDYRDPQHSVQSDNNILGKIFSIDLITHKYQMISKGHRNPQGLYYDKNRDIIYSTEHGPKGGDEVNINNTPDLKEIENFGWPISSYGVHYGEKRKGEYDARYLKEPLYKSHKDYGFVEPLKYFVPSIGISEILKIDNNYLDDKYQLWVAAMGKNIDEGDLSIHILDLKNDIITNHQIIKINQRIRDMVYIEQHNIILLFLETNASLGVIYLN